jgi:hypothetical protein
MGCTSVGRLALAAAILTALLSPAGLAQGRGSTPRKLSARLRILRFVPTPKKDFRQLSALTFPRGGAEPVPKNPNFPSTSNFHIQQRTSINITFNSGAVRAEKLSSHKVY